MRRIYLLVCLFISQMSLAQTDITVYPTPQEISFKGQSMTLPKTFKVVGQEMANPHAIEQLIETLKIENSQSKGFSVYIGEQTDKAVRKFRKMIPQYAEGYYLQVTEKQIVVAGYDERGTYYAVQTLTQLLKDGKLPIVEVKDYPRIAFRGVVEGFYGTPWSHKARLSQLRFYGKYKMNTYIYGPKDDPYHSSPNWRKAYPVSEAKQISELVQVSKANEVDFVWAIHPGKDIKWNAEDRDILLGKFEMMYQLGVRSFAVFFDDISGEGTKADRQAELLNYLDNNFVKVKKDVTPLIMCPTEYNKSWSNIKGGYLPTLGKNLNPSVHIMWTGDRVISDITEDGLKWINSHIERPAYIWWNFPVSDYVRDHLLMGAVYGLDTHVGQMMSGFVTNPMEYAEASKPAIFSVADYAWNPAQFNSDKSWKDALATVLSNNSDAFQTFANHNSDLGANGHGYRRDESVEIQPTVTSFLSAYKNGKYEAKDFDILLDEFNKIAEAADRLLVDTENKDLIQEMTPWLYQFKILGEAGQEVLAMVKAVEAGDKTLFLRKYKHLKALQQRGFEIDQMYNQNPYQPGVKSGSKVMQPLVDHIFVLSTQRFNQKTASSLSSEVFTSPHKSYSTVPQFKQLPVRVKGKNIIVSPILEVVKWGAGEYLGIELDKEYTLMALDADFGMKNTAEWLQLEVSVDGKTWTKIAIHQKENRIKADLKTKAKYIRIQNKSDKEEQAYLRRFNVNI